MCTQKLQIQKHGFREFSLLEKWIVSKFRNFSRCGHSRFIQNKYTNIGNEMLVDLNQRLMHLMLVQYELNHFEFVATLKRNRYE